jgi:5'(3')-deoxyribonucleotidase
MKRLAVDMDDTIADTSGELIARYNAAFGEAITKEDLAGGYLPDVLLGERRAWVVRMFQSGDLFADLPVVADSQEVLRALAARYEVFITSAAMEVPSSFAAKFDWLRRHFPFVPTSHIVFCGDKSILSVDYLVDDQPRHFERLRGQGILYSAPHNLHESRYPRVHTWAEVDRLLLDYEARTGTVPDSRVS